MTLEELQKLLEELGNKITGMNESTKASLEKMQAEIETLKGAAEKTEATEVEAKSFNERIDKFERKLNEMGVNAGEVKSNDPKTFAEVKSLDAKMRAGEDIEKKDFPANLKKQDIFIVSRDKREPGIANRCNVMPTRNDAPKVGFSTAGGVVVEGVDGALNNSKSHAWQSRICTVENYRHKGQFGYTEVQDAGASLLDVETEDNVDNVKDRLDQRIVERHIDAGADTVAAANRFDKIKRVTTAAAGVVTADEIIQLVTSLKRRYRRNACIVMSPEMVRKVMGLKDGDNRPLWIQSLQDGVPSKLVGVSVEESEGIADDVILLASFKRSCAVRERQKPELITMNRNDDGDYVPVYLARYGVCVLDANAAKILKLKSA